MKFLDDETVELNKHDLKVLKEIKKYIRSVDLETSKLEKVDLQNIANAANTKAGHVKEIIDNIEID